MAKKKSKNHHPEAPASSSAASGEATANPPAKMKRKEYEGEMGRLHGELVAMQEWVKASGAKICIVFEGRDTAGKGGTIKRITERVSPRVFRVVALPEHDHEDEEGHLGPVPQPGPRMPAGPYRAGRHGRSCSGPPDDASTHSSWRAGPWCYRLTSPHLTGSR